VPDPALESGGSGSQNGGGGSHIGGAESHNGGDGSSDPRFEVPSLRVKAAGLGPGVA